jgi:PAS domain-containing protein
MVSEDAETTLRARIAALEAELEQLRDGRAPAPRSRDRSADRLVVNSVDELGLIDLDLALQIIDALPVQVFIKHAHHEIDAAGKRGRRYTFMNHRALELAGWDVGSESGHLDCDAIVDPAEYERMDRLETRTIEDNRKRTEELRWTSPDGSSWRINDVTQLPIARRSENGDDGEVVGFCALAEDIVFTQRSEVLGPIMDIMAHEIGNLASVVLTLTKDAADGSEDLASSLNEALGWCRAARGIADAMLASYSKAASDDLPTAGKIIDDIVQIFEHLPIEIPTAISDEIAATRLKAPVAVRGVLVELVRNGFKHTSREFRYGRRVVRISAEFQQLSYNVAGRKIDRGCVRWRVTNKSSHAPGELKFGDQLTAVGSGMGGSVILRLIAHALFVDQSEPPASALGRYIRFDKSRCASDAEIDVYFYAPIETVVDGGL